MLSELFGRSFRPELIIKEYVDTIFSLVALFTVLQCVRAYLTPAMENRYTETPSKIL